MAIETQSGGRDRPLRLGGLFRDDVKRSAVGSKTDVASSLMGHVVPGSHNAQSRVVGNEAASKRIYSPKFDELLLMAEQGSGPRFV